MRVLICGLSDWDHPEDVWSLLDGLEPAVTEVIHGGAPTGVDAAAAEWAAAKGVAQLVHAPDVTKNGADADRVAVQEMLNELPDLVVSLTWMNPDNIDEMTPLLATDVAFEDGRFEIQYYMNDPRFTPAAGAGPDAPPDLVPIP